jgi:hypothetical protein
MPDSLRNQVADPTTSLSDETRALYELQKPFVEPMLRMFRLTNTALDVIFYDVGVLTQALWAKGTAIDTEGAVGSASSAHPLQTLDLSAATNPSGSIIVVDASDAPYVRPPFLDMGAFFAHANGPDGAVLHTLAVSGVGSSAYGSVAFAWDVSAALGEPVAAIVPGYGLADVVPQALGGWFGFEFYGVVQTATQNFLAHAAPSLAIIGKDLARTPQSLDRSSGVPPWQRGIGRCSRYPGGGAGNHPRGRPQQGRTRHRERAARPRWGARGGDFGTHLRLRDLGDPPQELCAVSRRDRRPRDIELGRTFAGISAVCAPQHQHVYPVQHDCGQKCPRNDGRTTGRKSRVTFLRNPGRLSGGLAFCRSSPLEP